MSVHKGSAQGSLFGTFSYNVLSNDMFDLLDSDVEIYNYADDNTIVCAGKNLNEIKIKLTSNINRLIKWYNNNNMKINAEKFQCIVFGKVDDPGEFIIDNHSIVPEVSVKLLGLHVDNKLNFNNQVSHICQKASRQINVLARLSRVLNEKSKMLLYNSFVECYFNYCCVLWHFCSNTDTVKVEKLQKRALRYVTLNVDSSYEDLLQVCDKAPLYIVRLRRIAELVYKINHDKCPSYLNDLLKQRQCNRTLRYANNMQIPSFKTVTYGKKSLKYNAPYVWNTLNEEYKLCESLNTFKHLIKSWNGPTCQCGFCVSCRIVNI